MHVKQIEQDLNNMINYCKSRNFRAFHAKSIWREN